MNSTFEILTTAQVEELMQQQIDDVKAVVSMPDSDVRILLNHIKWNKNELLIRLTDENRDAFVANILIANPFANDENVSEAPKQQSVTCAICSMNLNQKVSIGLGCGHAYCPGCIREYLINEIMDENATESIYCSVGKCDKIVGSDFVMQVVTDADVRRKYQHLMRDSFVQHNPFLRWCPAQKCELAIRAGSQNRQNCTCPCGERFCFNCGDCEWHDPIPCDLMSKWKNDDYIETHLYANSISKMCPGCTVLIEKDGDKDLMTCRLCAYEFCWNCCDEWIDGKMHKNCLPINYGDLDERGNLLIRYKLNEMALYREKVLPNAITDQIQKLMKNSISYVSSQYLITAVEILCESRKQQMLSYIFAYWVKPHPQLEIFKKNQEDLQQAIDKLSESLEQEITNENAMDFVGSVRSNAEYCKRRQNDMEKHVYEGSEKNWWSFEDYW